MWGAALVLPAFAQAPDEGAVDPCALRLRMEGQVPVVIHSLEALQAMGDHPGGHYVLGASIDASATAGWNGGAGFVPVGRPGRPFSGVFDGRGHSIRGLTIRRAGESHVGLLGLAQNATLCNVGLVGGRIEGRENVGALVGAQRTADGGTAQLSHVYATAQVQGAGDNVGGLVGHNDAFHGSSRIAHAYATGAVTGEGDNVGGLVGHNEAYKGQAHIAIAYASGPVTGAGSNVGGLVGHNEAYDGTASIADAYATGAVKGRDYAGGLVGYNDALSGRVSIARAYSSGTVVAGGEVMGGLVGLNTNGEITQSFYATTDAAGNTINHSMYVAGEGRAWQALQQRSTFAGWSISVQGDCTADASALWCLQEGRGMPSLLSLRPPPAP